MRTVEFSAGQPVKPDGRALTMDLVEWNKNGQRAVKHSLLVLIHDQPTDIIKAWLDGITPYQALTVRDVRDAVVIHVPEEVGERTPQAGQNPKGERDTP